MQFGMLYEIQVPKPWQARSEYDAYQQMVAQVQLAETMGFESCWTVEHHFLSEYSHCSAPEVLYGYLAAKTSRLRLGHGVVLLPFPYNHPIRVAERIATLDLLSNGRVEFGTGRSGTLIELDGFGIPLEESRARWEEALDMIPRMWMQETFSHAGTYFQVPERIIIPKPLQKPHPPIWMAATSSESHEIAGRKGLGLLSLTTLLTPEDVLARIQRYRTALPEAKPVGAVSNPRVAVLQVVHCAPTMQEARANAEASVMWFHEQVFAFSRSFIRDDIPQSYRYLQGIQKVDTRNITFDYLRDNNMITVGDPEHCIERLKIYHESGVDLILCLMQLYTVPHQNVLESIRLFGTHVIPYFQSLASSQGKPLLYS
jgi:alkanesulfonate monooxygenase SsuD/methylene tetrahydromethanopterin reductase-like flavin-dependent oxidoreductase (luciferase family)